MKISKTFEITLEDSNGIELTLSGDPEEGGITFKLYEPARGHGPGETLEKSISISLSRQDVLDLAEAIEEVSV